MGDKKQHGGHNKHIPNDVSKKMISNMATYLPQKHVAKLAGMDIKTLRKHYMPELTKGAGDLNIRLVQTAFEVAIEGKNPTMLIFLMKTRLGMCETNAIAEENETEVNGPIEKIEVTLAQAPNNKNDA